MREKGPREKKKKQGDEKRKERKCGREIEREKESMCVFFRHIFFIINVLLWQPLHFIFHAAEHF